MEQITIDKCILDFLRGIYFGKYANPYEAVSNRAYLDLNRTIRFNGISTGERGQIKSEISSWLEKQMRSLNDIEELTQEIYDEWHQEVCKEMIQTYTGYNVEFHYGQAQKWVNMSMKYLYIIGECSLENVFPYLHVPIDNYIIEASKKELNINKPTMAWSRWDYSQYISYQNELRSKITDTIPIRWEFKYWLKEARGKEILQSEKLLKEQRVKGEEYGE